MTHDFTTLTTVLGRCSAKVADQVITEIRTAINDAVIQRNNSPAANLTKVSAAVHQKKTEQAAARRAKAAERKAQKADTLAARQAANKAEYEAQAEHLPESVKELVAKKGKEAIELGMRHASIRRGPCGVASRLAAGSAEAELPDTYFTPEMVKYLRRCPDQYMLAVLNSYFHLIVTGNLVHTADDHRYLDNFITLTRQLGLIDNPEPPTAEQAATFLFDNPALPLPRAQRRAIERLRRKQFRRHSPSIR